MTHLDTYLDAVRMALPRQRRDDIIAELRDSLLSQLEAEEAERGRPPTGDEVAAVLSRFGAPYMVAARYGARDYLIGPRMYPFFVLAAKALGALAVLAIVIAAVIAGVTADEPAGAIARVVGLGALVASATLGVLTLVFARLDPATFAWAATWPPGELPPFPPWGLRPAVPRSETLISLLGMTAWLLWWLDVIPASRWLSQPLALEPAPIWTDLTPAIVSLTVAQLITDGVAFVRPRLARLHEAASALWSCGLLAVVFLALRAGTFVMVTDTNAPGASLAPLLNWVIFSSLLGLFAIAIGYVALVVRGRLRASRWRRGGTAAANT